MSGHSVGAVELFWVNAGMCRDRVRRRLQPMVAACGASRASGQRHLLGTWLFDFLGTQGLEGDRRFSILTVSAE